MIMQPFIVYYSRTGNTQSVAQQIASNLGSPAVDRIHPTAQRRYSNWLLRSFLPGSSVAIEPVETDLASYDVVFLGTPKWTLSCPPVTEYIERADFDGATIGLFMTYGGFDEERYLDRLVDHIQAQGGNVVGTLHTQRDEVETADCADRVADFCDVVTRQVTSPDR